MPDTIIDAKYYQTARPDTLAERLVIGARAKIYRDFMEICLPTPENTILDVGISDVVGDAPNFLERMYPYRQNITAAGLGTAEAFQAEFPEIRYVRIAPNARLPFADRQFDIATSNAVLEHVGSASNQRAFVAEMLRVAKRIFITVPHRYFPVEHHTGIPLLHYLDASFALACRLVGKSEWSDERNLILMSRTKLVDAWPTTDKPRIGLTGVMLGPFSSNLYAYGENSSGH
jgi:hypothetical protein